MPATTGEHRFKRSDLVERFGGGAWTGDRTVSHVVDTTENSPQSSRSDSLKYPKTLCAPCNNARSRPFDLAYEQFARYFVDHREQILAASQFHWSAVFRSNWRASAQNVVRFWVKLASCALWDVGVPISPHVIQFLDGHEPNSRFDFNLEIRDDMVTMFRQIEHGGLLNGGIGAWLDRSTGEVTGAWSHFGIDWLRINWQYAPNPSTPNRTPSDRNLVRLDHGSNLEPDQLPQEW